MAGIFKSKTFIFLAVVAILLVAGKVYYAQRYPTGTWRYKMTVEVETPEGLKTGSAVREVHAQREPRIFPDEHGGIASATGEAVVVDLGKRGVLFTLMKGKKYGYDYGYMIVFGALSYNGGGLTVNGIRHYSALKTGKATLTPEQYPMLVKFGDISDPKTVQLVDPGNLAGSFGPGVKLKDITIEMTSEPVTWGIEKVIPWFGKKKIGLDFYHKEKPGPENYLTSSDFKHGEN